jgi:hypothetical protein
MTIVTGISTCLLCTNANLVPLALATDTKKGNTPPVHMLVRTRLSGQFIDEFFNSAGALSKLSGCWTLRTPPGKP